MESQYSNCLLFIQKQGRKVSNFTMSESEEESSNSENNWPMNEDWMLDILKDDDKSEAKVKINVIQPLNMTRKKNKYKTLCVAPLIGFGKY